MKVSDPRIRSLLRQAKRTAGAGKRAAAQQLYEQITDEAPEVVAGWLGIAQTARDPAKRRRAYERVLVLDPENEVALQALDGTIASSPAETAATATEIPPAEDKAAPVRGSEDPFDQSRAWLQEATRRQEPRDKAPEKRETEPEAKQPKGESVTLPSLETVLPAVADADEEPLVCYRHPGRETGLRCYSCERPICIKCAKRTPVGYRCPECIREAEGVFYTAGVLDYLLAASVSLILGVIAGFIVGFIGFFVIFIGPAAGSLIGRIAFRAARRRRGRWLPHLVAGIVAIGGLLPRVGPLVLAVVFGQASVASLGFGLIWPLLYVFLATGAAYYQVK